MTLQHWASTGWLRPPETRPTEIRDLHALARRHLADVTAPLPPAVQLGYAYHAALKLCTVLLYASGYRPEKTLQHYRALQALPLILGPERKTDAEYLDACRIKRNTVEYDYAGAATRKDAQELIEFCKELREAVIAWLEREHIELTLPEDNH